MWKPKMTDPVRVRDAACMVRAMRASCQVPRLLPSQQVMRLAAWELRLDLPDILRNRDAKRLAAAGLTREYSAALLRAFPDSKAVDRLVAAADLLRAGLPPRLVPLALDAWDTEAPARLVRDPYGAVFELKGGTLEDAEAVSRPTSLAARAAGQTRWWLLAARRDGHTMLPTTDVLNKLRALGESEDDVRQALATAVERHELVLVGPPDEHEGITDPDTFLTESRLANEIRRRLDVKPHLEVRVDDAGLTPQQLDAVRVVFSAALSVLTGGPGTGKSTVVRALVAALGEDKCLLTAPTGRAARNVGGNTVHSASGGRLLKRRPIQETTRADVPDDLKLLVVDEASMLSTELMVGVLALAPPGCHVVLVGDADQLPPVGCGNVLRDLMDTVPVARLTHNHRSCDAIQALAAGVLRGAPVVPADDDSVRLVAVDTSAAAMRAAVREVVAAKARGEPLPPVLTPHNATRGLLNRAIQSAVMHQVGVVAAPSCVAWGVASGQPGMIRTNADARATFYVGDKSFEMPIDEVLSITRCPGGKTETLLAGDAVMALKNQNKKRLAAGEVSACNGDIGTLARGSGLGSSRVVVSFGESTAEFPRAEGWLTLAYAATVHKFQGSECDAVVLPIAGGGATWDRTLLYTAITRARTQVVILGTERDLVAVSARRRPPRHSVLHALLS